MTLTPLMKGTMQTARNYPLNQWMEMGDDCECGAPREIRITGLTDDVLFVTKRVHHVPGCYDSAGESGLIEETDMMSWEFNGKTANFGGVDYPVISKYANGCPCLRCCRLTDTPILLFLKEGRMGELAFCKFCVEKHKMLEGLVKG